ncbi:MAG: cyclic peptide export ABC transporter [Candidatus Magnetomorum sp.]|nr:cyclic peptide export ABC transporter [Candidatus Magnetomorum sp.]
MSNSNLTNIVKLYQNECNLSGFTVIFMAVSSGIAQSLILSIITLAANSASMDALNTKYLLLYSISFVVFYIGKRYSLVTSISTAQNIIRQIRVRLYDKIRKSHLSFIENNGKGEIYSQITLNTDMISQTAPTLISGFQSAIVIIFCLIYIATLSFLAFFMTVVTLSISFGTYILSQKSFSKDLQETMAMESRFCEMINDGLDGYKELKMNQKKSDDHFKHLSKISTDTENLRIKVGLQFASHMMLSQISFYLLLAVIGFLMPKLGASYSELIIRITAAVLFMIGPVNIFVLSIPELFKVNVSIGILYGLEDRLNNVNEKLHSEQTRIKRIKDFEEIIFDDVIFHYGNKDDPSFSIGPINLRIRKGETIFIVGGNGCGKTTLLKLMTGLYYHHSGKIKIDNKILTGSIYQSYRELFSVIYSDFHLFKRLYGIEDIDYEQIDELLTLMQLYTKTDIVDKEFTNIQLSTGQRKRIAMIVSMLDNKPICIFDEWAADQDPLFKDYFYDTLLKDLKAQGKTIIAVSHDDRYFDYADRVLKMEFGNFIT